MYIITKIIFTFLTILFTLSLCYNNNKIYVVLSINVYIFFHESLYLCFRYIKYEEDENECENIVQYFILNIRQLFNKNIETIHNL